ncbi:MULTISPECIES: CBS domain-containing protein [Pseudoalteromonas]|uniref:CBS domain-containing protein n=1 Tax=Pseudoalteromonas amylolytica TaxID=1859457 RepID=A0A1S1MM89_9GAMM|nr:MULTISPECIES: CBS domain-containing protein [Pseudoalteromonas]MCF6435766.1 CBS domain-containing protein [Pseudoalteromonas sp. MMG022]OHU86583.1 CBS domain-containing protein [Pseudoalteromonas sp. JW3]OHU88892.1 CBS domain-containing protein [Pseudoalteromonas amylolytica]
MQSIKVADYLNHRPVTFSVEMRVELAVEKLLQSGQPGGPVIDSNKRVVGFLSEQDCLRKMLEATYQNESHSVVGDVMTANPVCVKPEDSIVQIADKMTINKPKLYPVIDDEGRLLGVISRANVLLALDKHLHDTYLSGHRYV